MLRDILIGVLVSLTLHHLTTHKRAGGCGCSGGARVLLYPQGGPVPAGACAKRPAAPLGDFSQSTGPGPMRRY